MKTQNDLELILNATWVSFQKKAPLYDFKLDESLAVRGVQLITSLSEGKGRAVWHYASQLRGVLFELNHIRVDPSVDNTRVLVNLSRAFEAAGIVITSPPAKDSIMMCYKPLGELSDSLRFYMNEDRQLVFLSNAVKLKLVQ